MLDPAQHTGRWQEKHHHAEKNFLPHDERELQLSPPSPPCGEGDPRRSELMMVELIRDLNLNNNTAFASSFVAAIMLCCRFEAAISAM
eukprot:m.245667 g.245667  ORF g.245667 m.245667 type:complete len:88 (+) comp33838_c1_seq9:153-416(+)